MFLGPQPVTLQMINISPINDDVISPNIRNKYTVTEKADGMRKLLFINKDGKIFLIDTNMNIQFTGVEQLQLKMVDALGNVIAREVLTSNRKINVSDLNSGIYFLVFEAPGSKSITRKLVVRH